MDIAELSDELVGGLGGERRCRWVGWKGGEKVPIRRRELKLDICKQELDRSDGSTIVAELTVDGLALRQVAVVLASEQRIAIAAHDALDVADRPVRRDKRANSDAARTRI